MRKSSRRIKLEQPREPARVGELEIFAQIAEEIPVFPFKPGRTDGPLQIDVFGYEYYAHPDGTMIARIWPDGHIEVGPWLDFQRKGGTIEERFGF